MLTCDNVFDWSRTTLERKGDAASDPIANGVFTSSLFAQDKSMPTFTQNTKAFVDLQKTDTDKKTIFVKGPTRRSDAEFFSVMCFNFHGFGEAAATVSGAAAAAAAIVAPKCKQVADETRTKAARWSDFEEAIAKHYGTATTPGTISFFDDTLSTTQYPSATVWSDKKKTLIMANKCNVAEINACPDPKPDDGVCGLGLLPDASDTSDVEYENLIAATSKCGGQDPSHPFPKFNTKVLERKRDDEAFQPEPIGNPFGMEAYRTRIEAGKLTCITRLHWSDTWLNGNAGARRLMALSDQHDAASQQLAELEDERHEAAGRLQDLVGDRRECHQGASEKIERRAAHVREKMKGVLEHLTELGENKDSFLMKAIVKATSTTSTPSEAGRHLRELAERTNDDAETQELIERLADKSGTTRRLLAAGEGGGEDGATKIARRLAGGADNC